MKIHSALTKKMSYFQKIVFLSLFLCIHSFLLYAHFRLKHNFLIEGVRSLKTDLGHQKVSLREVRSRVTQHGDQIKTECQRLGAIVTRYSEKESNGKFQHPL